MAFSGIYFAHIKQVLLNPLSTAADVPSPLPDKDSESGSGSGSDSSVQTDNSDEYPETHYPGILAGDLTSLTNGQKNFFIVTVTILSVISVFGNVCTIVVNLRRKIRPFFRACLISLAFSDLMNTVFLSVAYMAQFMEEYVQIWSLGPVMCSLVPFATTAAILSSSMTLVGIAVDRYYAVMKAVIGLWHPTVISCIVCMVCIWMASIGIACPVFSIYDLIPVYILTELPETDAPVDETTTSRPLFTTHTTDSTTATMTKSPWQMEASQEDLSYTLVREQRLVGMCVSDQKDVTLYYAVVFVIIFIPCIGAFFWFNTIVARKIWKRRYTTGTERANPKQNIKTKSKSKSKSDVSAPPLAQKLQRSKTAPNTLQVQRQSDNSRSGHTSSSTMPSSLVDTLGGNMTTTKTTQRSSSPPTNVTARNSRDARHLRMFIIILLMMAVFLFLRLPAWVFLLLRMYGSYSKPIHWILYFTFGVMNLASSVLNPLFYTFLTETINYIMCCKLKVTAVICGRCRCCCHHGNGQRSSSNTEESQIGISCCGTFGCLHHTWQWKPRQTAANTDIHHHHHHPAGRLGDDVCPKDNGEVVVNNNNNNEKDEGVDCSEEIENGVGEFDMYNYRIYTIYPASLVSSSINSQ